MTTPGLEKQMEIDVRALEKKFQEQTSEHFSDFPYSFALYCYSAAYSLQQEKIESYDKLANAFDDLNVQNNYHAGQMNILKKENKELRDKLAYSDAWVDEAKNHYEPTIKELRAIIKNQEKENNKLKLALEKAREGFNTIACHNYCCEPEDIIEKINKEIDEVLNEKEN